MAIASINHIDVDEHCVARIAGTRLKVHILIAVMNANGYTAEQMMEGYPSLSKAQVYAMLAYYHDHQEQVDRQIREYSTGLDRSSSEAPDSEARRRAKRIRAQRDAKV